MKKKHKNVNLISAVNNIKFEIRIEFQNVTCFDL